MKTFLNAVLICLIMIPATMLAQTQVSGTVTDQADAMPLPGVNILIKGTSRGASTDFDGNFTIEVSQGETIVVSYVGYRTQEIIYTGQATIDVALVEDAAQLDEVVLIGYGSTTKQDATGVVEQVSSEEFNYYPNTSALRTIADSARNIILDIARYNRASFSEDDFQAMVKNVEAFIIAQNQLQNAGGDYGDDSGNDYQNDLEELQAAEDNWDF